MPVIEQKTPNLGGISDSDLLGADSSYSELVGIDIHSEPGFFKVNQQLKRDDPNGLIDDFVRTGVACSDGNTYFFGSTNGKVWKRTAAGTWSLEATLTPPSGSAGVTGCFQYEGFVYYAMQNRLGRWTIGTSWATRDDNFATFTNGSTEYHPMIVLNRVLYIGDKNLVAQVDTGVFSANALDLPQEDTIKCLGQLSTDLLIGTTVNFNIGQTQIYRWNTWSVSFTNSDPIPETGINSFLATDNFVIVNAGKKGNLYIYDGSSLEIYKQIKGSWDGTNQASVYPDARMNFNGLPLFGISYETGDPTTLGVYSLGRANRNYSYVLNCEYVPSPCVTATPGGHPSIETTNLEIGSIISAGNTFLVTWRKGPLKGVDVMDIQNKFDGAYATTRLLMPDRMIQTSFSDLMAGWKSLPFNPDTEQGKSIEFWTSKNYDSFEQMDNVKDDKMRHISYTDTDVSEANVLQVRMVLRTKNNNAPVVDMFHVNIKPPAPTE